MLYYFCIKIIVHLFKTIRLKKENNICNEGSSVISDNISWMIISEKSRTFVNYTLDHSPCLEVKEDKLFSLIENLGMFESKFLPAFESSLISSADLNCVPLLRGRR